MSKPVLTSRFELSTMFSAKFRQDLSVVVNKYTNDTVMAAQRSPDCPCHNFYAFGAVYLLSDRIGSARYQSLGQTSADEV